MHDSKDYGDEPINIHVDDEIPALSDEPVNLKGKTQRQLLMSSSREDLLANQVFLQGQLVDIHKRLVLVESKRVNSEIRSKQKGIVDDLLVNTLYKEQVCRYIAMHYVANDGNKVYRPSAWITYKEYCEENGFNPWKKKFFFQVMGLNWPVARDSKGVYFPNVLLRETPIII